MSTEHSLGRRGESQRAGRLSRRNFLRSGAAVTAVASLGLTGLTGTAAATKPKDTIPIDGPTVITEPGYYVLTNDIIEGGIQVESDVDDVTIDGQGYTLDGRRKTAYGILAGEYLEGGNAENITVKNLCVTRFVQAGIQYEEVRTGAIQNVQITHCGSEDLSGGVVFLNANDVTIADCLLKGNSRGISTTEGSQRSIVVRNRIISNGRAAFFNEAASDLVFKENLVKYNDLGVSVNEVSNNPTIVDNVFYKNGNGLELDEPVVALVRGNRFEKNGEWGIFSDGFRDVVIEKNTIVRTDGPGIIFAGSGNAQNNRISKNTIKENAGEGIRLRANNTQVSKNIVTENGNDGLLLVRSDDNEILKNVIRDNDGDGIELRASEDNPDDGSDNNVIRKNVIKGNGGLPIRIDDASTGNIIEKNKTDEENSGGNGGNGDGNEGENDDKGDEGDICRVS